MKRASLALALGLVLSGCSFADADSPAPINACETNADCGDEQVCDPELRSCVSRRQADYQVVLGVTTPATESMPAGSAARFGPMTLDDAISTKELRVRDALSITGIVAIRDDSDLDPLAVELLWTPLSTAPGPRPEPASVPASGALLPTNDANSSPPANFVASLRAGTDYSVRVLPLGESLRLISEQTIEVSTAEIETGYVRILYEELETVEGEVLLPDQQPLAGATVQAVHPATGEVLSGRAVSDETGHFQIAVDASRQAEGDVPWLLRVGPSSELPWLPVWRAELRDISFGLDGTQVTFPNLPQVVPVEVVVEAEPARYLFVEVGGAQVVFSAEITLVRNDGSETTATVSRSVQTGASGTDGEGTLKLELPVGTYDVVIVPPSQETNLAPALTTGFRVLEQPPGGTQRGQTFRVKNRLHLEGDITDANGRPLSGVNVEAAPVSAENGELTPVAYYARSTSTVADLDGRFDLPVDRGLYDLTFKPVEDTDYPWLVLPAQRVLDENEDKLELDVELGAPVVLRGEVVFESGRDPTGAQVSAFAEFGTRYLRIGRTSTRSDGSFELYLPASLP